MPGFRDEGKGGILGPAAYGYGYPQSRGSSRDLWDILGDVFARFGGALIFSAGRGAGRSRGAFGPVRPGTRSRVPQAFRAARYPEVIGPTVAGLPEWWLGRQWWWFWRRRGRRRRGERRGAPREGRPQVDYELGDWGIATPEYWPPNAPPIWNLPDVEVIGRRIEGPRATVERWCTAHPTDCLYPGMPGYPQRSREGLPVLKRLPAEPQRAEGTPDFHLPFPNTEVISPYTGFSETEHDVFIAEQRGSGYIVPILRAFEWLRRQLKGRAPACKGPVGPGGVCLPAGKPKYEDVVIAGGKVVRVPKDRPRPKEPTPTDPFKYCTEKGTWRELCFQFPPLILGQVVPLPTVPRRFPRRTRPPERIPGRPRRFPRPPPGRPPPTPIPLPQRREWPGVQPIRIPGRAPERLPTPRSTPYPSPSPAPLPEPALPSVGVPGPQNLPIPSVPSPATGVPSPRPSSRPSTSPSSRPSTWPATRTGWPAALPFLPLAPVLFPSLRPGSRLRARPSRAEEPRPGESLQPSLTPVASSAVQSARCCKCPAPRKKRRKSRQCIRSVTRDRKSGRFA